MVNFGGRDPIAPLTVDAVRKISAKIDTYLDMIAPHHYFASSDLPSGLDPSCPTSEVALKQVQKGGGAAGSSKKKNKKQAKQLNSQQSQLTTSQLREKLKNKMQELRQTRKQNDKKHNASRGQQHQNSKKDSLQIPNRKAGSGKSGPHSDEASSKRGRLQDEVRKLERQQKKLEKSTSSQAELATKKHEQSFDNALKKATGERVLDVATLKKMEKSRKDKKKQAAKKWQARQDGVKKQEAKKQEAREEHLQKRKDNAKKKNLKKRSGFEGKLGEKNVLNKDVDF